MNENKLSSQHKPNNTSNNNNLTTMTTTSETMRNSTDQERTNKNQILLKNTNINKMKDIYNKRQMGTNRYSRMGRRDRDRDRDHREIPPIGLGGYFNGFPTSIPTNSRLTAGNTSPNKRSSTSIDLDIDSEALAKSNKRSKNANTNTAFATTSTNSSSTSNNTTRKRNISSSMVITPTTTPIKSTKRHIEMFRLQNDGKSSKQPRYIVVENGNKERANFPGVTIMLHILSFDTDYTIHICLRDDSRYTSKKVHKIILHVFFEHISKELINQNELTIKVDNQEQAAKMVDVLDFLFQRTTDYHDTKLNPVLHYDDSAFNSLVNHLGINFINSLLKDNLEINRNSRDRMLATTSISFTNKVLKMSHNNHLLDRFYKLTNISNDDIGQSAHIVRILDHEQKLVIKVHNFILKGWAKHFFTLSHP